MCASSHRQTSSKFWTERVYHHFLKYYSVSRRCHKVSAFNRPTTALIHTISRAVTTRTTSLTSVSHAAFALRFSDVAAIEDADRGVRAWWQRGLEIMDSELSPPAHILKLTQRIPLVIERWLLSAHIIRVRNKTVSRTCGRIHGMTTYTATKSSWIGRPIAESSDAKGRRGRLRSW